MQSLRRCYTLMGPTSLECFDEEWMPEAPHCEENVCYPPGVEADSYIVKPDSTKVTSQLHSYPGFYKGNLSIWMQHLV